MNDFSDFSDDEFDLNDLPPFELNFEEENIENVRQQYCVCKQSGTSDMILCSNKSCEVQWFHSSCVGTEVGLANSKADWICASCSKTSKGACNSRMSTTTTTKKNEATAKKTVRKKAINRPMTKFTKQDAINNAQLYLTTALQQVLTHPIYTAAYPTSESVLALATKLHAHVESNEFQKFCIDTATDFWDIFTAGDNKKITPEANELVFRAFHRYTFSNLNVLMLGPPIRTCSTLSTYIIAVS